MSAVIEGSHELPPGYDHPHASEQARALASAGMILRVQVGSGVHGTAIGGQDDRDEMAICLEPWQTVVGLAGVPAGRDATRRIPFELYQRHTAWDRPGGLRERSGAGDLDVVVYTARKWCRLALQGNPTVLLALFAPDAETMVRTADVVELVDHADRFVSRLAADRFLGYLRSQRAAMTGERAAHTNRPELVARHGYDTKFAMHALRLGIQGQEFLTTGRITLPIPEPERGYLRSVRRGEVPLAEAVARIEELEATLVRLGASSALPEQPDRAWVDRWLYDAHQRYWAH